MTYTLSDLSITDEISFNIEVIDTGLCVVPTPAPAPVPSPVPASNQIIPELLQSELEALYP